MELKDDATPILSECNILGVDIPIGSMFFIDNKIAEVAVNGNSCRGCLYYEYIQHPCKEKLLCCSDSRLDNTNIIFKFKE